MTPTSTTATTATTTATRTGLTERLAEAALTTEVPASLHGQIVRHALVDTLAVAAAAAGEDGIRRLRSVTGPQGSAGSVADPAGSAPWAPDAAGGAPASAFLNGTAAHFLDFDDVSPTMPLHPSAVLVPALLAADAGPLTFSRFAEAFNVGHAMFRTIAQALPSHEHYARGWHSTSTVGRLAAVAALARLQGLDPATTQTALAMASTLASGSRANFGTMTKPMHAGLSAQDALLAVRWAQAGITANLHELEAPAGYFARFGDSSSTPLATFAEDVEERFEYWLKDWAFDWGLKRYPSCYGTHRAVDAVLDMRLDFRGDAPLQDIESIDVLVHETGTAPLRTEPPQTGSEAKFSLEYCVALALVNGTIVLEDFTPAGFEAAGAVRELARKVTLGEAGAGHEYAGREYATVSMSMAGGSRPDATVYAARGDSSNPLTATDLKDKVASCFAYAGLPSDGAGATRLSAAVDGLAAEADVKELLIGWTGGAL
ncbi:MmgE/PrpD family protein [Microbacterium sp. A93]|uniref:MmgE/PrpD family protein n=1 Tax=Microbacterium sp. A93 TaxID=3450716 RepID=UPI003F423B1B